jgi:hypothetical protein
MADPTLSLTFQDLIIRVAEFLGIAYRGAAGNTAADVPVDAYDLDLCKRMVNDGYRRFINANPKWNFLTPRFTLTFVAGQAEYDMPDGFAGSLLAPFTYPNTDSPAIAIGTTTEQMIRQWNSGGVVSGDPQFVAFFPIAATTTTNAARWKAIFWPTPSAVYVVTARARLYPDKLVNLTDRHICGFQHDEAVLAAVLAEAERTVNDNIGNQAANFSAALAAAVRIDREAAPKRIGSYGDRSDDRMGWQRPFSGVDTYNGNAV